MISQTWVSQVPWESLDEPWPSPQKRKEASAQPGHMEAHYGQQEWKPEMLTLVQDHGHFLQISACSAEQRRIQVSYCDAMLKTSLRRQGGRADWHQEPSFLAGWAGGVGSDVVREGCTLSPSEPRRMVHCFSQRQGTVGFKNSSYVTT